ncbi:MAG: hypothetical protein KAH00_02935, partial [Cocleimonas sp.]|nr:hypothetical protein [Cocleimonas sp.]
MLNRKVKRVYLAKKATSSKPFIKLARLPVLDEISLFDSHNEKEVMALWNVQCKQGSPYGVYG